MCEILRIQGKPLSKPPGEYVRKNETQELTGVRTSGGACGLIR